VSAAASHRFIAATLASELEAASPFSLHAALDVTCQIARALEGYHARGRVVPDLRPAKVIAVSGHGYDLVLADADPSAEDAGAPCFLAPEQLSGEPVSPWSNQYQLGLMLLLMAAGELPDQGLSREQLRIARCDGPPASLVSALGRVPPQVDEVVRTLLAASPSRRYPSATAARQALEVALTAFRAQLVRSTAGSDGAAPVPSARVQRPPSRVTRRAPPVPQPPARALSAIEPYVTLLMALSVVATVLLATHLR